MESEQLQQRSRPAQRSTTTDASSTRMRSVSPNSKPKQPQLSDENNDDVENADLYRFPRAVQVVSANPDHTFSLNVEQLRQILLDERVAGLDAVIVSVAGAFRKGKSFLLDFMLRYLQYAEKSHAENYDEEDGRASPGAKKEVADGDDAWLGGPDEPLTGFHWRSGSERDTTGMYMWSRPFIKRLANGNKVAVLLLDTQGTFDSHSTVKECATIFAVSTMISSVQVYNLSANIQEDDLQHLQLFTEYGRLALEQQIEGTKPFQHLMFLVRDWMNPYEYEYGFGGGNKLIKRRLEITQSQHHELQQLREHLRLCFEKIDCFLMPHPGLRVATNPKFDGRLSEVEHDFREQLKTLVPGILANKHLKPKSINGSPVKCRDVFLYLETYLNIYRDDERLPEPKSMLEATAEANNLQAVNVGKASYKSIMDETCGGTRPYIPPELLLREHEHALVQAIASFNKTPKMGGESFSSPYMERLKENLQKEFEDYRSFNESKNIFSAFRTPAVFFIGLACVYMIHSVLYFIGISHVITSLLSWAMWGLIVMIGFWAYCNAAGQADYLESLNDIADVIYDAVVQPLWHYALQTGMGNTAIGQMRHQLQQQGGGSEEKKPVSNSGGRSGVGGSGARQRKVQ